MFNERLSIDQYSTNIDHITRYEFASKFIRGRIVLDIACGNGCGSNILVEKNSRIVFGMDIDLEAVKVAQQNKENCLKTPVYVSGDAERIPLQESTVDVVVCLETIEHVNGDGQTLAELHRILKPGGILVLSTPNADMTQPKDGIPHNPYHVREYTQKEFTDLLSVHFLDISIFGQRIKGTVNPYYEISTNHRQFVFQSLLDQFPLTWRKELPRFLYPPIADWIVRRATNHNYYLRKEDIEIESWGTEYSPVLVAVCRK